MILQGKPSKSGLPGLMVFKDPLDNRIEFYVGRAVSGNTVGEEYKGKWVVEFVSNSSTRAIVFAFKDKRQAFAFWALMEERLKRVQTIFYDDAAAKSLINAVFDEVIPLSDLKHILRVITT